MLSAPRYEFVTNKAYEILSTLDNISLPIDIFAIIRSFPNIVLKKYSDISARFGMSLKEYLDTVESEYGFTYKKDDKIIICYNDYKCLHTVRFTLAHELGHSVLGHDTDGKIEEKEVGCFARNILCPVPISIELALNSVHDYCTVFSISDFAANITLKYRNSDFYYISATHYGALSTLLYCYMTGESIATAFGYAEY